MPTTKKPTLKAIEVKTWKGQQSVHYRQLANLADFKIRIDIKRDSYDMQSHATLSVFRSADLEWKVIYSIPYPQMASLKTTSPHSMDPQGADKFAADVRTLIDGAIQILF